MNDQKTTVENKLIKKILHACIREKFVNYQILDNNLIVHLNNGANKIICHNVIQNSLYKFKIDGKVLYVSKKNSIQLSNVQKLLKIIYREIKNTVDFNAWKQFGKEIKNCIDHEALVIPEIAKVRAEIKEKMLENLQKFFFEYVQNTYNQNKQLEFFEFWASSGHPYHPCHKTKLGFTKKDYCKYSPEFKNDVSLLTGAVAKNLVSIAGFQTVSDYQNWFSKEFPKEWRDWKNQLKSKNVLITDFCPIFIHPWQYKKTYKNLFQTYIDKEELFVFPNIKIIVKPSLSFRTVIATNSEKTPHIKLPVAVYATSAMRTVTPSSVHNGPVFCSALEQIFAKENSFDNILKVSNEICGVYLNNVPAQIAKNFGVIFRKNPNCLLQENDIPVVVAALFEKSPLSNIPLFIEMIHASRGTALQDAVKYFDEYTALVLRSYFDIFLLYGCALEGHQQNTIAVFNKQLPKYMIVRDFGGIRIHMPTLNERGIYFDAHQESSIIYDNPADVTATFLHTVLQYHLGELISLLSEFYHVEEKVFWKIVRKNLEERFLKLKSRVSKERWNAEYHAILENDWEMKGLMRMRLKNDAYHYESIDVPNPLKGV